MGYPCRTRYYSAHATTKNKKGNPRKRHDPLLLLLSASLFPYLATGGPLASVVGLPMGPDLRMEPYFAEEDQRIWPGHGAGTSADGDQVLERNLTVSVGQTAYLECTVRNLGAKKVGFIPMSVKCRMLPSFLVCFKNGLV